MNGECLPGNIRALRNYFGETQDELKDVLFKASRGTISEYENGKKTPDKDTIALIAAHYSVSVEDLLNTDLSFLDNKRMRLYERFDYVDILFPYITSEAAESNSYFKEAYAIHDALFTHMKNSEILYLDENSINKCFDLYEKAHDMDEAREEAIANTVSLFLLRVYLYETIAYLGKESAALNVIKKHKPEFIRMMEKYRSISDDVEANRDAFYKETHEELYSMLKQLCHSRTYSDVGYYFFFLCYWVNFTDNSRGYSWNQNQAYLLMNDLSMLGNRYATELVATVYDRYNQ